MSFRKVHAALDSHLQSFNGEDHVFPSHPYTPRAGQEFLVSHFFPGRSTTVLLGPDMPVEHRGLYQIDVRAVDVNKALDKIDQLRHHFSIGLVLTFETLAVTMEKSEVGANRGNLTHTNIPLTLSWRSHF